MKNKILRNTILTLAVSSLIAGPVFAQSIKPISVEDIKIMPINYIFGHWAEGYVEQLSADFDLEDLFKDKKLDSPISGEDFNKIIKLTIDKDYENVLESLTREALVYEFAKIWAEKIGKNVDEMPIIKMLIYQDTGDIDIKYLNGVYVAYMFDIAKGRGDGIFDPKSKVTYGELAVLANNTINAIKEEEAEIPSIMAGKFENRSSYEIKDGKVIFNFELMSHYEEAKELVFGSGQQFEIVVTNEEGQEVYRFSEGKFFTMALVYKTLNPGETLQWQDEWDMTNKEGEKLRSGSYKAEIKILAALEGQDEEIPSDQLTAHLEFTLSNDLIKPDLAKEIIQVDADKLLKAIKDKDAKTISAYVHPVKGLRFTPYTSVSEERDLTINKNDMVNFFEDGNLYVWGFYDGSGEEIELTPSQYYEKFIYTEDFINAPKVGYNEVLSGGNSVENQFEVYSNPIVVEYYIPEINPEYEGLDWQSLRLVFEEYEGSWKLVGIIHNQWTI